MYIYIIYKSASFGKLKNKCTHVYKFIRIHVYICLESLFHYFVHPCPFILYVYIIFILCMSAYINICIIIYISYIYHIYDIYI